MREFDLGKKREKLSEWLYGYKSKLGQGIINEILQRVKDQDKEFIKRLGENLVGLFDVYEIRIINEGGGVLTLRGHEVKRMIKAEIGKLVGEGLSDALVENSEVKEKKHEV